MNQNQNNPNFPQPEQPQEPPVPEEPRPEVSQPGYAQSGQPEQPQMPQQPEQPQEPQAPSQPEAPQPETPQPNQPQQPNIPQGGYQQNQNFQGQTYGSDTYDSFTSYIDGLKAIISGPQKLINGLSQSIVKALTFIGINYAIFVASNLLVLLVIYFKFRSALSGMGEEVQESIKESGAMGELWKELFKDIGLTAIYTLGFLFLIAGVVYVLSMMMQKQADFNKSFGLTGILSINFIAGAITSLLSILSIYISDLATFISLVSSAIMGVAFVYSVVLLIRGIVEGIGLSYFASVGALVITIVLGTFVMGKMIDNFTNYFSVSFGRFGKESVSSQINELSAGIRRIDNMLDYSDYDYDWDY